MAVCILLAQVVIFDHLVLFNCAIPFVFVYIILALPVTLSTNWSTLTGFIVGLTVDAFANTYGINALACTILAFARKPILHLYLQRDDDLGGESISLRTAGTAVYLKYAATMIPLYCTLALTIEAFGFFNFWRLLLRIVASSAYTMLIVYAIDSLSLSRKLSGR